MLNWIPIKTKKPFNNLFHLDTNLQQHVYVQEQSGYDFWHYIIRLARSNMVCHKINTRGNKRYTI